MALVHTATPQPRVLTGDPSPCTCWISLTTHTGAVGPCPVHTIPCYVPWGPVLNGWPSVATPADRYLTDKDRSHYAGFLSLLTPG